MCIHCVLVIYIIIFFPRWRCCHEFFSSCLCIQPAYCLSQTCMYTQRAVSVFLDYIYRNFKCLLYSLSPTLTFRMIDFIKMLKTNRHYELLLSVWVALLVNIHTQKAFSDLYSVTLIKSNYVSFFICLFYAQKYMFKYIIKFIYFLHPSSVFIKYSYLF